MLDAASGHPDVVVPVAADLDAKVREHRREVHPEVVFTADPSEVLDADVDAVYVATPPSTHAELAIGTLRRGLAILCEKPLAVSLEDGAAMLAAARASGAPAFVHFPLADRHAVLEMERALRAGELGEVTGVDIRLHFPRWPRAFQAHATWLAGREQGGFLREVFSHFAYLTDRLLGPLRAIDVGADFPSPKGAETAARGLLRAGEVPVHLSAFSGLSAFSAAQERCEWIMWGSRRSYLLRDWDQLYVAEGSDWKRIDPPGERGTEATRLSHFASAVRGQPSDRLADFAAAYRVQQVVESFHGTT